MLYTAGAVIFALGRPNPWPRTFGFHEIFHVFVILAAVAHFVAMAGWIVMHERVSRLGRRVRRGGIRPATATSRPARSSGRSRAASAASAASMSGCGTGRNTVYAASQARDGRVRPVCAGDRAGPRARRGRRFLVGDLADGLPAEDGSIDVLLEHLRLQARRPPGGAPGIPDEMQRVLSPGGRVVLHLAEPTDGYYGACPPLGDAHAWPHAVLDPVVGAGSVLFTLDELREEFKGSRWSTRSRGARTATCTAPSTSVTR